jgi:hypothetical protein
VAQYIPRQPVQQRGQQRSIAGLEVHLPLAQLALQHHDLVTQGKDLNVLVPVAHRQQSQHRQRVRHAKVGQSKQHDQASSPSHRQRSDVLSDTGQDKISP